MIAALSIGVMVMGGVTAANVATAPSAEAVTQSYTFMWNPWAPAGQQCQMFRHMKYSTWGRVVLGNKDTTVLYNYVPNYACGR